MTHLNPEHNASLAKLLATENLQVVHGSFKTASFEPTKRVLRLPVYKFSTKDVYDLMVGHEVGHALYTPAEGWTHGIKVEGLPAVLINIIEDVRIERKIQDRYPGLVRSFKLGYQKLYDEDFFGVKDRDPNTLGFLDRMNVKAKLRDLIDISFSAEEMQFVNRSEKTESWEDVIELCKDLNEYLKQQKEEATETAPEDFEMVDSDEQEETSQEQTQSTPSEDGDDGDQESESAADESDDEGDSEQSEEGESDEKDEDNESTAGNGSGAEQQEEQRSDNSDEREDSETDAGDGAGLDPFESITDQNFREKEDELVEEVKSEKGRPVVYLRNCPLNVWKDTIISTKELLKRIDQFHIDPNITDHWNYDRVAKNTNNYKAFLPAARKSVNHMVKEFELRRSADRHARARTSTKGTLDTTKLHTYKYNDEIFNQVTTLADGKNHGLMVLVDFSGSMMDIFDGTIKNAIQLAMFCRQVNIPFQIYGFTSSENRDEERYQPGYDVVDPRHLNLYDIFNHKQKKSEFERIADHLIRLTEFDEFGSSFMVGNTVTNMIKLGGTPLDTALLAMHELLPEFQKVTRAQIMNLFVLTDGESHSINYNMVNHREHPGRADYRVMTGKSIIEVTGSYMHAYAATNRMYASLKKVTEARIFGFHMTPRCNDAFLYFSRLDSNGYDNRVKENIKHAYRKQGYAALPVKGVMDVLYLMKPVSGEDDEFEVQDDISKQQLKKQFTKFMKAKKTNRLIFSEFGKMVA